MSLQPEGEGGPPGVTAFRQVPRTGVIFVMAEAARHGYRPGAPGWANLGQGQPETGPLPGAPARINQVAIDVDDHEYAPVAGVDELREAVAALYNAQYRRGRGSQYTGANVAICGGGRMGLARAAAALGPINLGHFLPDYTAYEELLEVFRTFTAIPIMLDPERGYAFSADELRRELTGRGLQAILVSNPANPTGKLIAGEDLAAWVDIARKTDCALLIDEFYSNYVWTPPAANGQPPTVSAAEFVADVDRDPVVLFNGLTKNWRYPGWRTAWVVGPQSVIEAVSSAGSFLDGGGSRPLQRAALPLLTRDHVERETRALHTAFAVKRRVMMAALERMGIRLDCEPLGTFYLWGNLSGLPAPLRDGMAFLRAALAHQVVVVPGEFFDVNPGKRRPNRALRFTHHVRFSFGPDLATLEAALGRLAVMVGAAERGW